MVKNPNSRPGYVEEFDIPRIMEIAERSKEYVKNNGDGIAAYRAVPGPDFSDLECSVWSIMNELIRFGKNLETV